MIHEPIILASQSKERLMCLQDHFSQIEVIPAHIDESRNEGESITEFISRLAREKAQIISKSHSKPTVAADTVIFFNDRVLGKAENLNHAKEILNELSGHQFKVFTATCLAKKNQPIQNFMSQSTVVMRDWNEPSLAAYLKTDIWKNRAGAFSITDPNSHVKRLDGDLDAVRGISLNWLKDHLSPKNT